MPLCQSNDFSHCLQRACIDNNGCVLPLDYVLHALILPVDDTFTGASPADLANYTASLKEAVLQAPVP